MKKLLFLSLICLQVEAQTYSLQKCISTALQNNPQAKAAQISRELSLANIAQAKTRIMPSFSAGVSQATNFGRSIDRFTNDYINQVYGSSYGNVQIQMPLFAGFQNKHLIEGSKLSAQAELFNIEVATNTITTMVIQAYLQTLASKELVQVASRQFITSSKQLERQDLLLQAGTIGKYEHLQIASLKQTALNTKTNAENNLKMSLMSLRQLLDVGPSELTDIENLESAIPQLDLDLDQITKSLLNLPQFKSLALQNETIHKQMQANKANNLPQLNLYGNYGSFYASSNAQQKFFEQLNNTRNGGLQLGLNIPIFGKLQSAPRTQILKVQQLQLDNQKSVVLLGLKNQAETAYLSYKSNKEMMENNMAQVGILKESLEILDNRLKVGTINPVELVLAQNEYQRAQSDLIQAKYNLILQSKLLNFFQTGNY